MGWATFWAISFPISSGHPEPNPTQSNPNFLHPVLIVRNHAVIRPMRSRAAHKSFSAISTLPSPARDRFNPLLQFYKSSQLSNGHGA
jgi:hypothetical protein